MQIELLSYSSEELPLPDFTTHYVSCPNMPKAKKHDVICLQEGISQYWNLAQEDLKTLAESPTNHGQEIRKIFAHFSKTSSATLTLTQAGEFVGHDKSHQGGLRQVVNILQIGRIVENKDTENEQWEFSKSELARYMIGIIAYNIACNRQQSSSSQPQVTSATA